MAFSATDVACEACACELDLLHLIAIESDAIVAKGLALSEVARIANLEYRTQQLLLAKWQNRATQAVAVAGSMAQNGRKPAVIANNVQKIMDKWVSDVERPYTDALGNIYKLARAAGWKKATKQTKGSLSYNAKHMQLLDAKAEVRKAKVKATPTFTLLDEKAIDDLKTDQMLWVGEHYDSNVRATVRAVTTETMAAGLGRVEAGKVMREKVARALEIFGAPDGYHGPAKLYFEGLAANTATTARVRGQLRSFEDAGATQYELVNPMDHRTSAICAHMNGKVFTVEQGLNQMEAESGVTDPDIIRKVHPWLALAELLKISPKAGNVGDKDAKALAEAGFPIPPFHFRCRTTVDVSF